MNWTDLKGKTIVGVAVYEPTADGGLACGKDVKLTFSDGSAYYLITDGGGSAECGWITMYTPAQFKATESKGWYHENFEDQ